MRTQEQSSEHKKLNLLNGPVLLVSHAYIDVLKDMKLLVINPEAMTWVFSVSVRVVWRLEVGEYVDLYLKG